MPVMMIAEVPGMTEEMYAGMVGQLKPVLETAGGFISHAGGPSPDGGWRVVEMWESEDEAQKWFDVNVAPNLPPGINPNRVFSPVHTSFTG